MPQNEVDECIRYKKGSLINTTKYLDLRIVHEHAGFASTRLTDRFQYSIELGV